MNPNDSQVLNDAAANEQTAPKDISSSTTPKQKPADVIPTLNSMWVYRPDSQLLPPDSFEDENSARDRVLRPGVSVTRLAKSLYYGFDPYFHRTYFEPFESRSKPVRLVALNRNGKLPRERLRMVDHDPNIAELQSPFNEISNFWLDENLMQQ
ncbi:uncharacterized protein LOC128683285 isoform X2 [Plodia interpunctella]|uniref:uncharacterized protein LOC128683285 isoform X2 n=1 Tax=Plodia interpunctella TaxID=58824 RepID=UPI0023689CAD|nr:uncharacterized protein LOC128683285 isoform X2 [Plodia interpunctella]